MEKPSVWPAMARRSSGPKAISPSGWFRPWRRPSGRAATSVAGSRPRSSSSQRPGPGRPWTDRVVDLRVEDHTAPLVELRRLVTLSRVYRRMNEGDEWTTRGDMAKAVTAYNQAIGLLPDSATNGEAVFWTGISLVTAGREREGCHTSRAPTRCIPRGPTCCHGSPMPACCRGTSPCRPSRRRHAAGPPHRGNDVDCQEIAHVPGHQLSRSGEPVFRPRGGVHPPRSRPAEQHQGVQEPFLHQLPGEAGRRQHRGDARVAGGAQPPQAPLQGRDPLRAGSGRG